MKKKQARKWLRAVRKLMGYYLGKNKSGDTGCSLCIVVPRDSWKHKDCAECLWFLFSRQKEGEQLPCVRYSLRHFNKVASDMRVSEDPRWVKLSIARLKRWEKKLIEIIETRP